MTESEFNLTAGQALDAALEGECFTCTGMAGRQLRLRGGRIECWNNLDGWHEWNATLPFMWPGKRYRLVPDPSVPAKPEFEDVMFERDIYGSLILPKKFCTDPTFYRGVCHMLAPSVVKGFECWVHQDLNNGRLWTSSFETLVQSNGSFSHAVGCRRKV